MLTLRFVPFVDMTNNSMTPPFDEPAATVNVDGNEIVPPDASVCVHLYTPGSRVVGNVPPTAGHACTEEGTHGVGGVFGAAGHDDTGSSGLYVPDIRYPLLQLVPP